MWFKSDTNSDSPYPHSVPSGQHPIEWPPVADCHSVPRRPQGQQTLSETGNPHPHSRLPEPSPLAHLTVYFDCAGESKRWGLLQQGWH